MAGVTAGSPLVEFQVDLGTGASYCDVKWERTPIRWMVVALACAGIAVAQRTRKGDYQCDIVASVIAQVSKRTIRCPGYIHICGTIVIQRLPNPRTSR